MYNNLITKNLNKIQIIQLNRPKSLNALNKELIKELSDCLRLRKRLRLWRNYLI